MFRPKQRPAQQQLWLPAHEIVVSPATAFYAKVNEALRDIGFHEQVRALCRPYYDQQGRGRPGIDPVVYFKMLIVGFFENLPSERAIAARCADSLSIRSFLGYDLTEATPDHSSLSVIRYRLGSEVYYGVFALLLRALKKKKLLKGKKLGIDASVLEANASLRSLETRLTGEAYDEFLDRVAEAAGVDPKDADAVRRFDKNRKDKKLSNAEWHSTSDPDAKIGPTKKGDTRMIYKVEHTVDLDTGAIVDADVLPGDQHDTEDLAERVFEIEMRMNEATGEDLDHEAIESITADKGYYKTEEIRKLRESGIKTIISDPINNRNLDKLGKDVRKVVVATRRSAKAKYGKALLKKRAEKVERSFAHVLESGGARRTTLRGYHNVKKRYLIQAMCCNLSLLMRSLIGVGTVKQALAIANDILDALLLLLSYAFRRPRRVLSLLRIEHNRCKLHFGT